jgi:hypothetical protein
VTNPIRIWMSEQVPVSQMPYRLRLSSLNFVKTKIKRQSQLSNNPPVFYYFRVSAVNAELGEGPFSNIVELRKMKNGTKQSSLTFYFYLLVVNYLYFF